ncbi:MAG: acetyl-CoA acetyltransferase [Acidimicrobiales bacterium]|nr:acetyl-CoA acetyltransferase [Acidimicrobiales bacterium]
MAFDVPARTPVLVGAAAIDDRPSAPPAWSDMAEVPELMSRAVHAAGADSGQPQLLAAADWVIAMRGMWGYHNPARQVADAIGATGAQSVMADIGILQTTPFARAAGAIAAGAIDVAVVCGAEAKFRSLQAAIAGEEETVTDPTAEVAPDQHWQPSGDIVHRLEVEKRLVAPVQQYAMIENAFRARHGQSIADHRAEIGALWTEFNRVAQSNEAAWFGEPRSAAFLTDPSPDNRMLAFPYNKWHTSQWNVNQGAAFVLCSAEAARAHGVAPDRWIFPWSVAESNHLRPLIQRPDVWASPGFEAALDAVLEHAGCEADALGPLELYSCFPIAVRVQADHLGLGPDRLTCTGGMAFAGGPLNNFVLQGLAAVVARLRAGPGGPGLVTAVSGLLTKQGAAVFSAEPPPRPFESIEVGPPSAPAVAIDADRTGPGQVVSYTVRGDRDGPVDAVVLVQFADGVRTLATQTPPDVAAWTSGEPIGRRVEVTDGGVIATV